MRATVLTVLAGLVTGLALVASVALVVGLAVPEPTPAPAPSAEPPAAPSPLTGHVVVLDPGHQLGNAAHPAEVGAPVEAGGFSKPCNTTGTSTDAGYAESTFVFQVAQLVRVRLRGAGARVLMTREHDSRDAWGPCVDVRGRAGNRQGADLKVSLHADGAYGGGPGFHVIAPKPLEGLTDDIADASWRAAGAVSRALARAGLPPSSYVGGGSGLHRRDDLATLNLSDVPAVLVELGNMRDPEDAARMSTAAGRRRYADALAAAVLAHLR